MPQTQVLPPGVIPPGINPSSDWGSQSHGHFGFPSAGEESSGVLGTFAGGDAAFFGDASGKARYAEQRIPGGVPNYLESSMMPPSPMLPKKRYAGRSREKPLTSSIARLNSVQRLYLAQNAVNEYYLVRTKLPSASERAARTFGEGGWRK